MRHVEGSHSTNLKVSKIDKSVLILLPNPNHQLLCMKYNNFKDTTVNDKDTKSFLPVYPVLGASEYAKIKANTPTKMGQPCEPLAEKSKFG